jgi:hypothetical protein
MSHGLQRPNTSGPDLAVDSGQINLKSKVYLYSWFVYDRVVILWLVSVVQNSCNDSSGRELGNINVGNARQLQQDSEQSFTHRFVRSFGTYRSLKYTLNHNIALI